MVGRRSDNDDSEALGRVNADLRAAVLDDADPEALFRTCCESLRASGVGVERAYLGFRQLHPLYRAKSFVWDAGGRLAEERHVLGSHDPGSVFRSSPQFFLLTSGQRSLRRRLAGAEAELDFPILEELAGQGFRDYRGFVARFGRGDDEGVVGSWATRAPDGFGATELTLLAEVESQLAVLMKGALKTEIARALVDTYLGGDAGRRVLSGQIKRGDAEEIEAVIWYADLRDSSRHAERLGPGGYLSLLDRYFEAVAGPVAEAGGQILLLIGDAVLAVFPIERRPGVDERAAGPEEGERRACRAALDAAGEAMRRLQAVNAARPGEPPVACGLALHIGRFLFGNIGVPDRLQFTAVGPAINLAARLEALCKPLGEPLLASAAFAERVPDAGWRDLGHHALRGLADSQRVLAPEP